MTNLSLKAVGTFGNFEGIVKLNDSGFLGFSGSTPEGEGTCLSLEREVKSEFWMFCVVSGLVFIESITQYVRFSHLVHTRLHDNVILMRQAILSLYFYSFLPRDSASAVLLS